MQGPHCGSRADADRIRDNARRRLGMHQSAEQRDPTSNRIIRIGMLWHSLNSGNLGVGALTLANLAIARSVASELGLVPEFVIMAPRDRGTAAITVADAEVFPIDRRSVTSRSGFWYKVGKLDCVLDIGAGDSFADIYGPRRFFFLWITKMLAVARKVPLLLSPQTIGPFTKPGYKAAASMVMAKAAVVMARDEASRNVAKNIAPSANVKLSVDVAFVLPFEDRSIERNGQRLRIGLNVSGLLWHEAENGQNRFGLSYDYCAFTRELLTAWSAREDVEVHLISHATSNRNSADDDGAIADRMASEFPKTIRVPNFLGPSEAKSYISSLDFLAAARMHACIGAFSAGTPVVPVAYSRKFSGLFGLLGYSHVLPEKGLSTKEAADFVFEALESRDVLLNDEATGMARVENLLDTYRQELRTLFQSAAGSRL